jgi:hypothetical protein
MRVTSVLVAAALAATSALAVQAAQEAAAVAPPYNVITASADLVYADGTPFIYNAASLGAEWTASANTTSVTFDATPGSPPDTTRTLHIGVSLPTDPVVEGMTYDLAPTPGAAVAVFDVTEGGVATCSSNSGSLRIDQLTRDGSNNVTVFAAHYVFSCEGRASVTGELRFNSTTEYRIALQSQATWDFGRQLVKGKDVTKKFVFTNRGSVAQTFTGASISQPFSSFGIVSNTCTTAPVAAGGSCTITVIPHPKKYLDQWFVPEVGTLHLAASGLPTSHIQLQVEGSELPEAYLRAGPGHISVNWGKLPAPINSTITGIQVYRGTTKSTLTKLRTVNAAYFNTTDNSVTTGKTYYYRVRPVLTGGTLGDLSPVMAAIAWPKYTSGMYHRLPGTVRFVADHEVHAGNPFAVKVLGQHGVPGSGVSAVALNLTAGASNAATSVRVYPAGAAQPKPADLLLKPGVTRTNVVIAKAGRHGRILISTSQGSVPVDVDVTGYFSGSRLAHKYGKGAALQEYAYPGTIMDTKAFRIGALKHDYYVNAPVNFSAASTPHVTSLLVEVTAYGSKGSGTITGYRTNGRPSRTNVVSYSPNTWTSSTTIIRAGRFYDSSSGRQYPSVSFLNRGPKPVQLIVSILGFFDDDTYLLGQRYTPTAPFHLFGKTLHAGTTAKFNPGKRHSNYWTTSFNTKIAAANPTRTTWLGITAIGGGHAPKHGQVDVPARVNVAATTLPPTGIGNEMAIHNTYGTVTVNMWSFGRFDAYPVPRYTPGYTTSATSSVVAVAASPGRTAFQQPHVLSVAPRSAALVPHAMRYR